MKLFKNIADGAGKTWKRFTAAVDRMAEEMNEKERMMNAASIPEHKKPISLYRLVDYLNRLDLSHPKNKNTMLHNRAVMHKLDILSNGQGVIYIIDLIYKKSKHGIPKLVSMSERNKPCLRFDSIDALKDMIRTEEQERRAKYEK